VVGVYDRIAVHRVALREHLLVNENGRASPRHLLQSALKYLHVCGKRTRGSTVVRWTGGTRSQPGDPGAGMQPEPSQRVRLIVYAQQASAVGLHLAVV